MSQNPEALKSLLTAVLTPPSAIKSISIKNPNIILRQIMGKEVRLDFLVTLEDQTVVDIEMQTSHEEYFETHPNQNANRKRFPLFVLVLFVLPRDY